jgi:hypothetical protein
MCKPPSDVTALDLLVKSIKLEVLKREAARKN